MTAVEDEAAKARRADRYSEFLRAKSMSAGVYVLAPGAVDHQQPHDEDEVYYVVRGQAMLRHGSLDDPVRPGDALFVPAHEPHRFHSITEELVVLVVFAPAESGGR